MKEQYLNNAKVYFHKPITSAATDSTENNPQAEEEIGEQNTCRRKKFRISVIMAPMPGNELRSNKHH
jgi:hypothetical protein